VLDRGVYSSPLEEVQPGTPAILPKLAASENRELNRLDLARWMTRPDHPLVARVAVNRTWEAVFGRGLAASSADFGSQSPWPTHPELLDWLAVHFSTTGWDVKALLRLMVTSRTYRQSSDTTPEMLEQDPRNDWLGRAPRWRLGAEQVRDQALAVSGLLVERLGGPSVLTYQPGDLWRQISHYGSSSATSQTFVQDHGEKLYRRSIYTYWKRTLPPVNLAVFDAPNREVCTIGRTTTNTPLQALVLLNDPQFVEAARAQASKVLLANLPDDTSRLARLFTETTGRPPETKEMETLTNALNRERARYEADTAAARAVLAVGESPVPDDLSPSELAAWMQIAGLVHNLSETVTRR
jgi:plasmid stability protein